MGDAEGGQRRGPVDRQGDGANPAQSPATGGDLIIRCGHAVSPFRCAVVRNWKARDAYTRYLQQHDQELLRLLVPYDPVITVAEDVVFFECFSADESSYGCLTVERDAAFGAAFQMPGADFVDGAGG